MGISMRLRVDNPFITLEELNTRYVNNKLAAPDEKVYENFSLIWTMEEVHLSDVEEDEDVSESYEDMDDDTQENVMTDDVTLEHVGGQDHERAPGGKDAAESQEITTAITVTVNQEPVHMLGKSSYIYVDVFDLIHFDLSQPKGKSVVTLLNGTPAQYTEILKNGDVLDIYWKD